LIQKDIFSGKICQMKTTSIFPESIIDLI